MEKYIVNKDDTQNPGWHHEVHTKKHADELGIRNQLDLGYHDGCTTAVAKAKEYYSDADGCITCCYWCHKG